MRSVIEKHLQKQNWQSCLDTVEIFMADNPPDADQAFLLIAMCRCYLGLGDYFKGVSSGEVAGFLAKRVGDWDLVGEAIYRTGLCHYYGKGYEQAIRHLEEFFSHEPRYLKSRGLSGEVLFIQGCARLALRQYRAASERFARALDWALERGTPEDAEWYRINLIWALLESGQLEKAEEMITCLEAYVTEHPDKAIPRRQALHDRAHLLYLQNKFNEAFRHVQDTIEESVGRDPLALGWSFLTLHYMARALGHTQQCVHLALAVKRLAIRAKSPLVEERINESLKQIHRQVGTPVLLEALSGAGHFKPPRTGRNCRKRRAATGGAV